MIQMVVNKLQGRRLDVDAAIIGLVMAICMFPLRFLASQIYIQTIPIVLGLATTLYLLTIRSNRSATQLPALPSTAARLLPTAVFTGIAAMILVAVFAGERSVHFYDLAGVAGSLILFQILFTRERDFNPALVLAQVVGLAIVVRFAALYTTSGFIGIDIWTHIPRLAGSILQERSLSAIATDKHFAAPFYHLLVVTSSILFDVSLRNALYLSLGVVMPFSVLFVYAITKLLVPVRWAVLATMLYSVGDYVIEWGIHLIPTSHGLVLFLGVIYSLVRIMQIEYNVRDFVLLVLFTVAVILTHQVSSFIMLVVIGSGLLAQFILKLDLFQTSPLDPHIFRTMNPVNLVGLLAFDIGLITFMWSFTPYNGNSFLETVLSYLAETVASSAGFMNLAGGTSSPSSAAGGAQGPSLLEQIITYVDTLGFLILLCATIVGCLYVLHRQRAKHSVFTLLFATTVMVVFVLGLPLFGIRNFIPQRWFAFLYVPMAILSAVGIRHLARTLNRRIFIVCLLLLSAGYPAVMVMSSNGTIDSPVFPNERERLSYTEAEVDAVSTIGQMTGSPDSMNLRSEQVLRTDHPYQTVFRRTGAYPTNTARIEDGSRVSHNLVVYRTYQSTGASYFLNSNDVGQIRDIPKSKLCRPGQSTLYANGKVVMCHS